MCRFADDEDFNQILAINEINDVDPCAAVHNVDPRAAVRSPDDGPFANSSRPKLAAHDMASDNNNNYLSPIQSTVVGPQRLDEDGDTLNLHASMTFNNNNLISACGKPPKVNPTPSWGGSEVGDYQVLLSNDKKL